MMSLFDFWLKLMKWGLIVASPVMVLVFACLPVIDHLSPWQEAETMIVERLGGGWRLCVGMASSKTAGSSEMQRSYLFLNRTELVTVFDSSTPEDQALTMEASRFGFWFVVLFALGSAGLSAVYSIPQINAKIKSSRTTTCP